MRKYTWERFTYMTNRLQILDMIGTFLTEKLGTDKVTQRSDGILIVAGTTQAFAIQALIIDAPGGIAPEDFGKDLVRHIEQGQPQRSTDHADGPDSDGEMFYTSENGDRWLLVTDAGGRKFVRHIPNQSSGGVVELTDLQSFIDREPHSPQNEALKTVLHSQQAAPLNASPLGRQS